MHLLVVLQAGRNGIMLPQEKGVDEASPFFWNLLQIAFGCIGSGQGSVKRFIQEVSV